MTVKDLRDVCSHLINGGPRESGQEASHLPEKATTCERKKDSSCVGEGGCSTKEGVGHSQAGLSETTWGARNAPKGQSRSWGATLKTMGRLVRRDISGCHPHDTSQRSPNFAPGEFSARPHLLIQAV